MHIIVHILASGLALQSNSGQPLPPLSTETRKFEANAGGMLNLARALVQDGRVKEARLILDVLARDPDPDIHNEARFRQALLLESDGRSEAAAVLLRRILDEKPDATAVRLKLAMMLRDLGHEEAAFRELRALSTFELPPNVARFVDRLSTALQATKPLGVQIEFALAPDSNINRATRSDTLGTIFGDFTLDKGSRARSGTGAAVRGFAQARHLLTSNVAIVARASEEANLYRHSDFNDIALSLSVGPELRLGRTRLSAEAALGRQWYGMKPFQHTIRVAASASRPIDSVSQLRLDSSARWTDNRFNSLQDGRGLSVRAEYERAFSANLLVGVNAGVDRFMAHEAAYSTHAWTAGISASRIVGRTTLSASFDIGHLKADDRLVLLPRAREDRLTRFSFGAVLRQLTVGGFAPVTRLVIERNRSTVEFYDFKRVRTEFGISRAF